MPFFCKCCPCSEGIETARADLERLAERFETLQGEQPKVCCVDNCCSVRSKLKATFGQSPLVLLDAFHWCKRWDNVLCNTNSGQAAVFRGMIHEALCIVETSEFNRAKFVLRGKLKKEPTTKEMLKEAKATIPEAETSQRRVEAVVQHCCFSDLAADVPQAANAILPEVAQSGPMANRRGRTSLRYFRPMSAEVRNLIGNQLGHVSKGLLV